MSLTRRLTAVAAVAAATLTMAAPALAAPAAAPAAAPKAKVTLSSPAVTLGSPVTITVTGLAKSAPVTVTWGDGAGSTRLTTTCTDTKAATSPSACKATATRTYAGPRIYSVNAKQKTATIFSGTVTVSTAPVPLPEPTPIPTPTPTPTPAPAPAPAAWEAEMLSSVNTLRASVGVGPVSLCPALGRSAQKHAVDMATRNYFAHNTPEGLSPGNRINAEGYTGGWGENIAAGYNNVPEVMDGWINSPGHYANLVRASFTHIGFGQSTNNASDYGMYWAQNFGYGGTC